MPVSVRFPLICAAVAALAGCAPKSAPPNAAEGNAFVARLNADMGALNNDAQAAGWVMATYINTDTQAINARANERYLEFLSKAVAEAKAFDGVKLDEAAARSIALLKLDSSAPAPDDPAKRSELATIMARMEATYGEGKYCVIRNDREECRNIDALSETIAKSRNYEALTEAWAGWHSVGAKMRDDYTRFVQLANEGARELGYADLGALWRSRYDMTPEAFEQDTERLWGQVKPLYEALHCYTRTQLAKKYGEDKVPAGKPIPAQLFGNLWAQQWNNIYEDILKPYPAIRRPTLDSELVRQKYDAKRITEQAESFYTSLGMPHLPSTFWERSMLTRPRDREVVCHASAWNMNGKDDVRIKQCILPTEEDLSTTYHELGHVYYYLAYRDQPYLFQSGAHDGFHEAIGDTVLLSMTPGYLAKMGLGQPLAQSKEAVINEQMKMAADKIAFLPFGKLIDQWRWKVFSGEITPENYNKAWWELRQKYQGVAAPVARSESDFDPAAKYHIPGNTPYTRYFLSFILQFQFHRALCQAAGITGPLHECSIFGSKEAGEKFWSMLQAGASRPWPETLEKLTGTRQMDASAIIEYFQPLMGWLEEENKGQQCGWE
jgi:peptidyl-dipeptidase A